MRTFTLIGLLGGVCGALSEVAGSPAVWLAGLALLTAAFGAFSYRQGQAERDYSVTNTIAAMLVFSLGVMAVTGDMRAAGASGVVAAGVLAIRAQVHRAVAHLTWIELRSALLLLAMTAVVLPLLPDRAVDPLGSVNPRELWLLTTLIAAVSYCGYIALKVAGPDKGPPIAGLAGGLASSTAATIALARRSREIADPRGLGSGAALAAMVSLCRASLLAILLQPALGPLIGPPAGLAALVFGICGVWPLFRPSTKLTESMEIGIPFELRTVLLFGLLLTAMMFLGAWVAQSAGAEGGYLFAAVSGLVDVDAITLSMARATQQGAANSFAATAILVAFAANAAQRVIFAWSFGSRAFAVRYSAVSVAALASGFAAAAAMRFANLAPI